MLGVDEKVEGSTFSHFQRLSILLPLQSAALLPPAFPLVSPPLKGFFVAM